MGCCDPWDYGKPNGVCPECGEETVDGDAAVGCRYSPINCEECGSAPCDLSC